MSRLYFLCFLSIAFSLTAQAQWKLTKDNNGIKVYSSTSENSKFKSIRVICTLEGNYDKLINILTNIDYHPKWIYKTKTAKLLKKNSPIDLHYYSVVSMPWPVDNRDAIVHLVINNESLPQSLKIDARSEPAYLPNKEGFVRIPFSHASWIVTMKTSNSLNIDYTFQVNPGGNLPPWLVNLFADKGPFESFKKLSELLKE